MNKLYRLLLIGTSIVFFIAILSFIVFHIQKWQFTPFFVVLPLFFLLMIVALIILVRQYEKKQTVIEIGAILGIRMMFLMFCLILFIIGIILNKSNALIFTILFVIYYIAFAIVETKTLMKLTKKEN